MYKKFKLENKISCTAGSKQFLDKAFLNASIEEKLFVLDVTANSNSGLHKYLSGAVIPGSSTYAYKNINNLTLHQSGSFANESITVKFMPLNQNIMKEELNKFFRDHGSYIIEMYSHIIINNHPIDAQGEPMTFDYSTKHICTKTGDNLYKIIYDIGIDVVSGKFLSKC